MAKLSIKTGDNVVVISGKDKGKQGKVLAVSPTKGRVIVEGVNIVSRHTKPRSAQDQGGIIKREGSISVSNVMVICPVCGKATRVYHKVVDGKNVRVCKNGDVLDHKFVKEAKKADKAEKQTKATKEKAVKAEEPEVKEEKKVEAKAEKVAKAAPKKAPAKAPVKKAATKEVATKTNKTTARPAVRKTQKDV